MPLIRLFSLTKAEKGIVLKQTNRSVSVMRNKGSLIEEPLFFECLQERGGHGLVVLAGIADVCEDLGEGFFVVDAQELEVLGQVLLVIIVLVDVDAQAAGRRGEAARRATPR